MAVDFTSMLQNKYHIQQQEADARTTSAGAEANLANARAKIEIPGQAALSQAQASHFNEQTRLAGMQAQSQAGLQGAQADYYGSHAALNRNELMPDPNLNQALIALHEQMRQYWTPGGGLPPYGQQAAPATGSTPAATGSTPAAAPATGSTPAAPRVAEPAGSNWTAPQTARTALPGYNHTPSAATVASPNYTDLTDLGKGLRYSDGTAQVPGKGPGNVDTVPAMLAPHEAVLNAGAAQHVGPHLINVLNALGAHKMAVEGHAPQPGPQDQGPPQAAPSGRGMPAGKSAKGKGAPPAKGKPPGHASGTPDVGSGSNSYDSYVRGLQVQDPNSTANVVSNVRAKLTGQTTNVPRPQPVAR